MGALNVGEAAHIYGANLGAARYDAEMGSANRAAISNAVWLCANCHKIVDDDELRYPAGLLFEWQRDHERWVANQVGKAGAELRRRYEDRHLEEFGKLSYLAERLILEKGDLWEYRLTSEVLRFEMSPILRRWDALKKGLYVQPNRRLNREEFTPFIQSRIAEIVTITSAFDELSNVEFARVWGAPGQPGDEAGIVHTCRLFAEMCESAITWEESVRFISNPSYFDEVRTLLVGNAGGLIDEARKVPDFFTSTLDRKDLTGLQTLSLTLSLPDGWSDKFSAALARATDEMLAELD